MYNHRATLNFIRLCRRAFFGAWPTFQTLRGQASHRSAPLRGSIIRGAHLRISALGNAALLGGVEAIEFFCGSRKKKIISKHLCMIQLYYIDPKKSIWVFERAFLFCSESLKSESGFK
jgi:hypothetical protein